MYGMRDPKSPVSQTFNPVDLLKELDIRKQVSVSFKSTSREQWQQAHASKTNPPEVGKYNLKFNQVDAEDKIAVIRDDHPSVGKERIYKREDEHLHVCLKAIKGLNYPTTHEKS